MRMNKENSVKKRAFGERKYACGVTGEPRESIKKTELREKARPVAKGKNLGGHRALCQP